jgi:hypothetical protein
MKVEPNPFHFEMPNVVSGNVGKASDTGYRLAVPFNLWQGSATS